MTENITKFNLSTHHIEQYIFNLRGMQVMVDRDLAMLYGVPTRRLNEQVSRNRERFLGSFMFQRKEMNWSQIAAG